jgi:hypothetical protein
MLCDQFKFKSVEIYESLIRLNTDVSDAFPLGQGFYSNQNGMKDDYYRLWDKLSMHFSSNPGVLGFDLFNEPL